MTIKTAKAKYIILVVLTLLLTASCVSEGEAFIAPADQPREVGFSGTLSGIADNTRATYPSTAQGAIALTQLQNHSFGVFAQYTEDETWAGYTGKSSQAFNFMWNQQVEWNTTLDTPNWTYSPVKYWPNDNQPADHLGAVGSRTHSYLQFFAYAPYVDATTLPGTAEARVAADGIVELTSNTTPAGGGYSTAENHGSYLYYRTSQELPFSVEKSVDLLWATKRDCYKYDDANGANDYGRVQDRVPLVFKHALSRVELKARALIDRTSQLTSPVYLFTINSNSRLFVDTVSITTPPYYSEGRLMLAPDGDVPTWDYTGVDASCKNTGFFLGSDADTKNVHDDVAYILRWNGTPADRDNAADAKDDFDALPSGVTSEEEMQLPAEYPMYLFLPTTETSDIAVRAKYYVVTYDPQLTLNMPKYYTVIKNDITAKLGNNDFRFEPNKQYKIVLNLGLTSVKFDVYVLDDRGEWILLSAVVKEWDLETKEANVE